MLGEKSIKKRIHIGTVGRNWMVRSSGNGEAGQKYFCILTGSLSMAILLTFVGIYQEILTYPVRAVAANAPSLSSSTLTTNLRRPPRTMRAFASIRPDVMGRR